MTPPEASSLDPSVCYRHPDRDSWTLCQRCGRTICPECQILTPSGVRCPDCVRETGGSVQWTSTNAVPSNRKAAARARARTSSQRERPRWLQVVMEYVRPEGSTGLATTWIILAAVVSLFVVNAVTSNLIFVLLAAEPTVAWQVWRFVLAAAVYPSNAILSVLISLVFFVLIARPFEAQVGRRQFLVIFVASSAFAAALTVLTGSIYFGLTGGLFGLIGASVVQVWSYPQARTRQLITVGIILLINIVLGGNLAGLVGGLLAGVGVMVLLRRYEDTRVRTAYAITAAGVVGMIVLAILRSLIA